MIILILVPTAKVFSHLTPVAVTPPHPVMPASIQFSPLETWNIQERSECYCSIAKFTPDEISIGVFREWANCFSICFQSTGARVEQSLPYRNKAKDGSDKTNRSCEAKSDRIPVEAAICIVRDYPRNQAEARGREPVPSSREDLLICLILSFQNCAKKTYRGIIRARSHGCCERVDRSWMVQVALQNLATTQHKEFSRRSGQWETKPQGIGRWTQNCRCGCIATQ
jgi:hypothetical protein